MLCARSLQLRRTTFVLNVHLVIQLCSTLLAGQGCKVAAALVCSATAARGGCTGCAVTAIVAVGVLIVHVHAHVVALFGEVEIVNKNERGGKKGKWKEESGR